MLSIDQLLVISTLLGAAIIGGGLFVFSSFIMPSLAKLEPSSGIAAMQSINVVVINLSFIGTFMATAALSVVLLIINLGGAGSMPDRLTDLGAVLYLIGTFLVTVRGNVPLNNELAAVDPSAPEAIPVWGRYLERWTRLNTLRTGCSLLAVLCFAVALTLV
ncbi:MAG: anthrone oxygenase family protein [Pseudomonadota bacterium]